MPFSLAVPSAAGLSQDVVQIYSATAGSGGVASFDTTTIDVSAYRSLELIVSLRTDDAQLSTSCDVWYNGDENTANYYGIGSALGESTSNADYSVSFEGGTTGLFAINSANAGTGLFSVGSATISSPGGAYTVATTQGNNLRGVTAGTWRLTYHYARTWKNTDAITRIVLKSRAGGNFIEGSTVQILGVK